MGDATAAGAEATFAEAQKSVKRISLRSSTEPIFPNIQYVAKRHNTKKRAYSIFRQTYVNRWNAVTWPKTPKRRRSQPSRFNP